MICISRSIAPIDPRKKIDTRACSFIYLVPVWPLMGICVTDALLTCVVLVAVKLVELHRPFINKLCTW